MSDSVLFEAPGPKGRRRLQRINAVAAVILAAVLGFVVWSLWNAGQFRASY